MRLRGVSRVLRPNHAQRFLLPPSLDEWVQKDHPVRFVSDFVDLLDLAPLGIDEPESIEGRPSYDSAMLLKVWLFGYMERIRSTRALEKACFQVMPFLWLTGNMHPDHNTLWRFFNKHRKALPQLFKALVTTAAGANLIGFALHAIDGTKIVAASSTDEALHHKALTERLARLDEFIATYMQQVSTSADKGSEHKMPTAMQDAEARRTRLRELLEKRIEDRQDASRAPKDSATKETKSNDDDKSTRGDGEGAPPPQALSLIHISEPTRPY